MVKKKALFFSILGVFFLLAPQIAVASLSIATVEVSPLQVGEPVQYTLGFYVGSSGALEGGRDEVIIYFPEGTVLPEARGDNLEGVFINGVAVEPRSLYFSERRLIITLPSQVQVRANDYVGIVISPAVGIELPRKAGSHYLEVETSRERRVKTNSFTIKGSQVSRLEVMLSPAAVDQFAELEISFRTGSQGRLVPEADFIFVELAPEFYLPRTIIAGDVEINGVTALPGSVEVDTKTNTLRIMVPPEVKIRDREDVVIRIDSRAGIRNPRKSGTYNLGVYTSADTVNASIKCQVGLSITTPVVFVNPNGAREKGQYTIGFTTSREGALAARDGRIYLEFPVGTSLPSSISRSQVTINGESVRTISTSSKNRTATLAIPDGIYIGDEAYVNIVFKTEAGIKNPTSGGEYQIIVSTSADQGKIKSRRYEIVGSDKVEEKIEVAEPDFQLSSYRPGEKVSLKIVFKEGALGDLRAGDKLHVIFPVAYEISGVPRLDEVQINGEKPKELELVGQSLVITLPDIEFRTYDSTEIKINAGIQNPTAEGDYNLLLCSSLNNSPLYNQIIKIRETVVGEGEELPWVELTAKESGEKAGYIIFFEHTAGDLVAGDTISLTFPTGTVVPANLSRSWIKINGEIPEKVNVVGNKLVLTLPEELKIEGSVTILIDLQAEIENPLSGGSYCLVIETSQGYFALSEAYQIGEALVEWQENEIVFQIDSKTVYLGKTKIELDVAPVILEGRAAVPLRALGDALGAETDYEALTRTIKVKYQDRELFFYIDSKLVKVNDVWKAIDVPATLIDNRVMIPARFVSESFGAAVVWEEETRRVIITK